MKTGSVERLQEDHPKPQQEEKKNSRIKSSPLPSQVGKILSRSNSSGALLLSSNSSPILAQIAQLREELKEFPSQWAGRRRTVRKIGNKKRAKEGGIA